MLIASANQERTRVSLIFSHQAPQTTLTFPFSAKQSKYQGCMFKSLNDFKDRLQTSLKESRIYTETLCHNLIHEKSSLERLFAKCADYKYLFDRPTISGSIYDCVINNWKVQCKTSSRQKGNLYQLAINKHGYRLSQERNVVPYCTDDAIDFVIIEITQYPADFYIIPREELINKGIFSSGAFMGQTEIYVPPPGYTKTKSKYRWILSYLNRWDLLQHK